MKWSEKTWAETAPVYHKIIEMPFIKELADGSLPREKFLFYIAQDDIYLQAYARTLAMIAARATEPAEVAAFTKFAQIALVSEQMMHEEFFKDGTMTGTASGEQNISTAGVPAPACHHYTSYLLSTAATEPVEVAMAAVLPCFWIYREVGAHIYKSATTEGNPYQAWIDTYVGEEFDTLVDEAIALCDAAAARSTELQREKMTAAYAFAARLEYDFWNAGYMMRKW